MEPGGFGRGLHVHIAPGPGHVVRLPQPLQLLSPLQALRPAELDLCPGAEEEAQAVGLERKQACSGPNTTLLFHSHVHFSIGGLSQKTLGGEAGACHPALWGSRELTCAELRSDPSPSWTSHHPLGINPRGRQISDWADLFQGASSKNLPWPAGLAPPPQPRPYLSISRRSSGKLPVERRWRPGSCGS